MPAAKKKPTVTKSKVTVTKNIQQKFTFAVEEELKDAFVNACLAMDSTASRELRGFMRNYLAKHGQQRLI
jgi:hypothetical protein